MKKNKRTKFIILLLIIAIFFTGCYGRYPIEQLAIIVGLGEGIDEEGKYPYSATLESLIFMGNDKIHTDTVTGKNFSIYTKINNQQSKFNKRFLIGSEIVYLISEKRARFGINDNIDSLVRDHNRNETAYIAVTKQSESELFSLEPIHAATNSEEIEGLLKFSPEDNFFEPDCTIVSMLQMYYQQGRNIIIPYIEIQENKPIVSGLALFKDDKMIEKVSLEEARLINLLRISNSYGFLSVVSQDPHEYIDFNGTNKVKVKVSKENDRLIYDIYVKLNGILTLNSLIEQSPELSNPLKVGNLFEENLTGKLNDEVIKMQKTYKTDWLDLGKYAVAKYGRDSGYDNDEYFSKAKINVHVTVKVESTGRKVDD